MLPILAALVLSQPGAFDRCYGKACVVYRLVTTSASGVCLNNSPGAGSTLVTTSGATAQIVNFGGRNCTGGLLSGGLNLNDSTGVASWGVPSTAHSFKVQGGFDASNALASFPVCDGTRVGRLIFDSTNTRWKYCDGALWTALSATATTTDSFDAHLSPTFNSTATPFAQRKKDNKGGTINGVQIVHQTVGVGTTGTAQLYNVTTASSVCTVNYTCTSAVGTVIDGTCSGTYTASDYLQLRLSADGCSTNPELQFSVTLFPTPN